ncbi:SGNH/GDSL hydrolase family protein [Variovorax sp. J22P271]|uniref:SGNH/GDSL hydrolase family protein n=1 Tax=Variovorax davisae TaxID=3053515 RepID=UPI002575C1AF|nr:SGNH/GDSL hydrolase family protein [Variovorax sp. J22P271]MDM0032067.1 SGNH/GDSL hydrolase family protein [Variovorax sp. J22P271]
MPTAIDLRAEIDDEKRQRIVEHQARVRAGDRMNLTLSASPSRLNLLAMGDSWFDYPFPIPKIGQSDVVAHLKRLPAVAPEILSLAHYGLATDELMGTTRRTELLAQLRDQKNGKFDAILFSGGGNDLAGDQFRLWLNSHATSPTVPLNTARVGHILGVIRAGYEDLIAARDEVDKALPIFAHGYDFAIPDARKVSCAGPWLQPGFADRGWANLQSNTEIVKDLLGQFDGLLHKLEKAHPNFIHVKTQGTLGAGVDQWANELHPTPDGFAAIAGVFVQALANRFPGRIGPAGIANLVLHAAP